MKLNDNLIADVILYVEENIGTFHERRIARIKKLKLKEVLKKKNPYLFKTKHLLTASDIVKGIVDAYISSGEETIFGDWLEGLAIFINHKVYGGWKSGIPNIDLEFDKEGIRYIVNIKSGPNWGNSSQIKKMISDFRKAKQRLRTSHSGMNVVAVNGCCYGKTPQNPDKGDFFKFCGQKFWEFISGNPDLYTEIIEPLGHQAKEKNEEFFRAYTSMLNTFTAEFVREFCFPTGEIDRVKFLKFNSGTES